MNSIHNMNLDELTFEDIERITQHSRRMRSQALAEMGTVLRSDVRRWTQYAMLYIRAGLSGNPGVKCS